MKNKLKSIFLPRRHERYGKNKKFSVLRVFVVIFSLCVLCGSVFSEANKSKAESYIEEGNKYYNKGDLLKAKASYQRAIIAFPDHATAHFNLAVTLTELEDMDGAIEEYKEVLRLSPQDATSHNNIGNLYAEKGNTDLAILEYNQAIKIAPKSPLAHNNLGDLFYKQGRYEDAVREFQEAVHSQPAETYGYNNLGNAYYKLGRYDDAVNQYNLALEISPRAVHILTNKAQAYIRKGSFAFALSCLNQALKYDPKNPTIYNLLGDVNVIRGETEEAIKNYEKTITIKKDYAEAYYKLGRLYRYTKTDDSIRSFKEYLKYGKDPLRRARAEKYIKLLEEKGGTK